MKKTTKLLSIISILFLFGCSILNENVVIKENATNKSAKKEIQEITKNNDILSEFEETNLQQAIIEENLFQENEKNTIPIEDEENISDSQLDNILELIDEQLIIDNIQIQ